MNDGTEYQGYFVGEKLNGGGKITYPNGEVYRGQCIDSKRHGHGTM